MKHLFCLTLGLLLTTSASAQITNGQTDDFQDGTLQGWTNGAGGSNITNVATGGPAGVGDRYLQVMSDGAGFLGKLVTFNTTQWTGDFTAAGVTLITADLNNTGATPLNMRVWLEGAGGWFVSTNPVNLAPGSGWTAAAFSLAPSALTAAGGFDVNATLANITKLRIYHNPTPTAPPVSIVATVGIDNVTAGTLPNYDLSATATTPLTVAAGGSVSFSYSITNNTASAAVGDLFYTATPGNASGVIINDGTLGAGQTFTGTYTQAIPVTAPPGSYTYTLRIGQSPGATFDSEVFTITVTPAPRLAGEASDWTVHEVTPWSRAAGAKASPEGTLQAAYPNPFNPSTTVRFDLPEASEVTVEVLDLLGRRVALLAEGRIEAGAHSVRFEASGLPSGVYLVRLQANGATQVQRLTLLK